MVWAEGGVSSHPPSSLLIKQLFCFFLAEALARIVTMPNNGIVAVRCASQSGGTQGQGQGQSLVGRVLGGLRTSGVPAGRGGACLASADQALSQAALRDALSAMSSAASRSVVVC